MSRRAHHVLVSPENSSCFSVCATVLAAFICLCFLHLVVDPWKIDDNFIQFFKLKKWRSVYCWNKSTQTQSSCSCEPHIKWNRLQRRTGLHHYFAISYFKQQSTATNLNFVQHFNFNNLSHKVAVSDFMFTVSSSVAGIDQLNPVR